MRKYDLIVAGGGFAGLAAAISAARSGLKVLLFDKSNCLGGAMSNCLVQPFMLYKTTIDNKPFSLCRGIFEEIITELQSKNKIKNWGNDTLFDDEYLKILLNRMIVNAGVEVLYHTFLIDVNKEKNRIKSVTVMGCGRKIEIGAKYFIDATGNAELSMLSGCPYKVGRTQDGLCQPMTLCFRVANVDIKKLNRHEINVKYNKFKTEGKIKNPREDVLIFDTLIDGVLHFNTTRVIKLDPCDVFDVTKAEFEAREQVYEIFDFLKENFDAFSQSEIISTASEIGIRESRMIDGEYVLKAQDLIDLKQFPDAIALGNYDMDIHNPSGTGTSHYFFKKGEFYSIPYRSLIPKGIDNMLVGGRCISAEHEAQAAIRIMPIVCCIGEACGAAIAEAFKENVMTREIDVEKLKKNLTASGAMLCYNKER